MKVLLSNPHPAGTQTFQMGHSVFLQLIWKPKLKKVTKDVKTGLQISMIFLESQFACGCMHHSLW